MTPRRAAWAGAAVAAACAALALGMPFAPPGPPTPLPGESVYTPPGRGFDALPESYWIRANFHSHARRGARGVGDDGRSEPRDMHEVYGRLGYDFSLHTPHSNRNTTRRAPENWLQLKELTEGPMDRDLPGAQSVGIELSVSNGPNLRWFPDRRYGLGVGHTINHVLVFGVDEFCTDLSPLKAAAEHTHAYGGLIFVAHPVIWEEAYWNQPGLLDKLDGIEVYNGIVLVKTGENEEARFRAATSYSGPGAGAARLAAIGGTDSHGLAWVKDVVTWVRTTHDDVEGVTEGIRKRRTFATRGFFDVELAYPQLGHVIRSGDVALDFALNRRVARIELWREQALAGSWTDASEVRWRERVDENTAYTFKFADGEDFGYTSPVWFEPAPRRRPDLVVRADRIEVHDATVRAVIANVGDAPAQQVGVAIHPGVPWERGAAAAAGKVRTIDRLDPGEERRVEATFHALDEVVWVKVDPEGYGRQDDDAIDESDERNNAAVRVVGGAALDRARRALAIRTQRANRRAVQGYARRAVRPPVSEVATLVGEYTDEGIPELESHD